MEKHFKFNKESKTMKTFIGYANDSDIRFKASSGGVGSALIKYLFEKGDIDYAITFIYNNDLLQYRPLLIDNYQDYQISGSIYHEIDMVKYLKENILTHTISKQKSRIVLFCLPCQCLPIKKLLTKYNINAIIIGLTCSSQQSLDATKYLLKRLHIKSKTIKYLQYRGNGWPSGIQIKRNDEDSFIPNNNSLWSNIFHSRLFIPKKCFKCQDTLNKNCDIILADPWLKEYIQHEKKGKTLFTAYTNEGENIINAALHNQYITAKVVEDRLLYQSQSGTIKRKESYRRNGLITQWMYRLFNAKIYRFFALKACFFKFHCKLKNFIENKILTFNKINGNKQ